MPRRRRSEVRRGANRCSPDHADVLGGNVIVNSPLRAAPEMTDKTGAEVIDIIERFNFNLGSAIDCIARAGGKTASGTIGDLERAQWHLEREIERIKHSGESAVPSSQTSATRAASQVRQLGSSQQNGTVWQDRMGDRYRFSDGAWLYLTAGQ